MKPNSNMKKRVITLCSIAFLCILIIAFGLSVFQSKHISKFSKSDEKASIAYNYLENHTDLSSAQIIGIISNIKSQSNFDTTIHQTTPNLVGLMCWSYARASKLEDFATQNGKDIDNFYVQLDYIIEEISEDSENFQLVNHNDYTIEDWNSVKNPVDAALIFESLYVRPGISSQNLEDIAINYAESL
ncbi:MAG: phage tail tip lysozyme [Clostridia bacterium]